MPRYPSRGDDAFHNVHAWDDGYEYLNPENGSGGYPSSPYASPPPPKPSRTSRYEPDYGLPRPPLGRDAGSYRRSRAPSPPPPYSPDTYERPRRSRRDRSPPSRVPTRSPTPPPRRRDGRRDHAVPPSSSRRPDLHRYDSTPLPRTKRGEYSPSPPSRRRGRASYSPSPSPPPRHRTRARSRDRKPQTRARSPGGRRGTSPSRDKRRPPVTRSKTTTAATGGKRGRDVPTTSGGRVPTIGPRWQAAATAALQSGAAAAMNMRSQPGAWAGQKGARVATAALGAAAVDALAGGGKSGRGAERGGGGGRRKSEIESLGGALGGLLLDQFAKGSRRR